VTPHDRFPEPYLNPMTPESWEVSLYNWRTLSAVNVAICDEVLNYKNLTHISSTIIKQNTPILQQQREHSKGSKSISGIVSTWPHLQNPKQTNNTTLTQLQFKIIGANINFALSYFIQVRASYGSDVDT